MRGSLLQNRPLTLDRRLPRLEAMEFTREFRLGLRTLSRNPGFFALAVATLAFGVGAATLVFSVAHSILWRPLPFSRPHQLVQIAEHNPARTWEIGASGPNFLDWRERARSFENIAAMSWSSPANLAGPGFHRSYSRERSLRRIF